MNASIDREEDKINIDVVMPIPETSRVSALQCGIALNVPYREGFIKNRFAPSLYCIDTTRLTLTLTLNLTPTSLSTTLVIE